MVPSLRWGLGQRQRQDPRYGVVRVWGPEASRADVQEAAGDLDQTVRRGGWTRDRGLAVVCR